MLSPKIVTVHEPVNPLQAAFAASLRKVVIAEASVRSIVSAISRLTVLFSFKVTLTSSASSSDSAEVIEFSNADPTEEAVTLSRAESLKDTSISTTKYSGGGEGGGVCGDGGGGL